MEGDTLISSRSLTVIQHRDRAFAVLDTVLRRRFPDMLHVGFMILTAHPSSKWLEPTFCPQREKVVVVYSDELLQSAASVLIRLSLSPHDEEGAIYVQRRLRLRTLVRQLGLSPLCGVDGDNCLCYVNGMELVNERETAVDDAAFIHCWMLPEEGTAEVELVSIEDSASQRSVEFTAHDQEVVSILPCQLQLGNPSGSAPS